MNPLVTGYNSEVAEKYLYKHNEFDTATSDVQEVVVDTSQQFAPFRIIRAEAAQPNAVFISPRGHLYAIGYSSQNFALENAIKIRTVEVNENQGLFIQSPFDELDLIRSNELPFLIAIDRFIQSSELTFKADFSVELKSLLTMFKEDYDGRSLSVESLNGMISFLNLSQITIKPSVTALSNSDLYAQWKNGNYTLSIHFMKTFNARYAMIKPDQKHPEQWAYSSGAVSVDSLWDDISNLKLPNGLLSFDNSVE